MPDERKLCLSGSGLTKIFGLGRQKTIAVDHVDFDFYEGEIVSIVGESGSGKTTLAKMLLGLINTSEGEIYFQGQKRDISSQKKKKEYWKNIQAIFQDPFSSYNIFNKIDDVLLDCINMRGGHGLPHILGTAAGHNIPRRDIAQQRNLVTRQLLHLGQRMLENRLSLKKGEDSLLDFQKSKGIVAVQQQAEATVQAMSDIETRLLQQEMQLTVAKLNFEGNSPQIQEKLNGIIAMRSQLAKMGTEKTTSIFLPISQIADDALAYSRLKRSVLIMDVLDQYLTKEYETAKLDEKSTVPTIAVLDSATVPEKRIKPKRKKIVLIMALLGAAVGIAGSYILFSLSQYKDVLSRNWCFDFALKLANKAGVSRVV